MRECFSGYSVFSGLYTTAAGAISVREDSSNSVCPVLRDVFEEAAELNPL